MMFREVFYVQITGVELLSMFDSEGANCHHVDADRQNIQINIVEIDNSRGILETVSTHINTYIHTIIRLECQVSGKLVIEFIQLAKYSYEYTYFDYEYYCGWLPSKIHVAKNLAKLYLLFLFPSTCSFSSPSSFSSTSSFSSSFPSFTSFIIFPQSIHYFLIFPLLICSGHSAKIHSTSQTNSMESVTGVTDWKFLKPDTVSYPLHANSDQHMRDVQERVKPKNPTLDDFDGELAVFQVFGYDS